MFCINCGREFLKSEKYCSNCGTKAPFPADKPTQNYIDQRTNATSVTLDDDYTVSYRTHKKKRKQNSGKKIVIGLVISLSIIVVAFCFVFIMVSFSDNDTGASNSGKSTASSGHMDCVSFGKSPTGMTFRVGIDEYTTTYNQACQNSASAAVSTLMVNYFDYSNNSSEEEVYYTHNYYNSDNYVAMVEIGVDPSTKKILEINYIIDVDNVWKSDDHTKNVYVKELPIIIYTSLGIPEETFLNSLYIDALNNGGQEQYSDGVNYCITADSDEILLNICACSYSNYVSAVKQKSESPVTKKDEEAKQCAAYQIRKQIITGQNVEVYDLKIVDSDAYGRYIVTASSNSGISGYDTWWVVLVKINPNGTFRTSANRHGMDGKTSSEWINAYKTDAKYGWGQNPLILSTIEKVKEFILNYSDNLSARDSFENAGDSTVAYEYEQAIQSENTASTQTALSQANESMDYYQSYISVFERYTAIANGTKTYDEYSDMNYYMTHDVTDSSRVPVEAEGVSSICRSTKTIGYELMDIDGNGIDELLIGNSSPSGENYLWDNVIFDMYTLVNNEPVRIFVSGDRYTYNLLQNNRLLFKGSDSASMSTGKIFEYANASLAEITNIASYEEYVLFESEVKSISFVPIQLTPVKTYVPPEA